MKSDALGMVVVFTDVFTFLAGWNASGVLAWRRATATV